MLGGLIIGEQECVERNSVISELSARIPLTNEFSTLSNPSLSHRGLTLEGRLPYLLSSARIRTTKREEVRR